MVFSPAIWCQKPGTSKTNKSTLSFEATLSFDTNHSPSLSARNPSTDVDDSKLGCIITKPKISIAAGDLLIDFELLSKNAGYFSISLDKVENLDEATIFPLLPERVYGDIGTEIAVEDGHKKRIIVANAADNANPKYLTGRVRIHLTVELYDYITYYGKLFKVDVQCNKPIQPLPFKKYIPNLAGLGAAAIFYGAGLSIETDSENIYNNQYKLQKTKQEAEPFYEQANNKNLNATRLQNIGIGILIADGVWTVLQQWIQRERKKTYQDNCVVQQKLTIRPSFKNTGNLLYQEEQLAVVLKYSF